MPQTAYAIAAGPGWRVDKVVCTDGPQDRCFEERHDGFAVSLVMGGTFHYRGTCGQAVLAPGSLLLGNDGLCFECGHSRAGGDLCLSFSFAPALFESLIDGIPGVRQLGFAVAKLPPSARLVPLAAQAAASGSDVARWEEIAFRFAGYAAARQADVPPVLRLRPQEERLIADAVHCIESGAGNLDEALSLTALAARYRLSPYRFLRLFHRLVGMTPHQYVLHLRLSRVASRLLNGPEEISAIAFEEGFGDLSTFNRRFRALVGMTPGRFRDAFTSA